LGTIKKFTFVKFNIMQRRLFLKQLTLSSAALLVLQNSVLAKFVNDPAYKIKMLTDNLGMFTEKGGTILFYLGKKEVVVVDSQFPDSANNLIAEIKKQSQQPFQHLINTHHHFDHTAGNISFKGMVKNVVAHKNAATNMQTVATKNKSTDKQLFPTITFDSTHNIKLKKEKVTCTYFGAGHTNGDIMVHFTKANVVHVGDLVFNRKFPYIDKSAGANINSWIKVLDNCLSTYNDKARFVCGHANTGYEVLISKDDIKAFKNYLTNLIKLGNEKIKAGVSKDDFMKITIIPGSEEWTGEGISRSLEAVWQELHP
jgi:cyclase